MSITRKTGLIVVLLLFCGQFLTEETAVAFWGENYLVSINGVEFSTDDYRNWWREYQEPGMPLPQTADLFVDWMLLSQEARTMQLQDNPAYRKKVQVFLKVRALMQLKAEEINAQTRMPTAEMLWSAYQQTYTPILDLRMLALPSKEQALLAKNRLAQGGGFAVALEGAGLNGVAELMEDTGPIRLSRVPEPLRQEVLELSPGEVGGPVLFGHSWYLIEVLERNDGSKEDFETVKQALIKDDLKDQQYHLTYDLVERLKQKYQVILHSDVIDAIKPEELSAEQEHEIAARLAKIQIPVKVLFAAIEKERSRRGLGPQSMEAYTAIKQRVVNDLLMQTLTGLEALERGYEKVPPLKPVYDFYCQHRLIKELEATLVQPRAMVTSQMIEVYYQQNSDRYSRSGLVELAVVKTKERQLAEKLNQELKQGADFFMVMRPLSPAGIKVYQQLLADLPPLIRAEVEKMSPGQVVGGLEMGEEILFIKLVRNGVSEQIPLEKVTAEIQQQLSIERFKKLRAELVAKMRSRSEIRLNQSAWERLQQTLRQEVQRS